MSEQQGEGLVEPNSEDHLSSKSAEDDSEGANSGYFSFPPESCVIQECEL
jgi:hypothetical protein